MKLLIWCLLYFQKLNNSTQINSSLRYIVRSKERGVWASPSHVCNVTPMLHSEVTLATLQESLIDTEQRLLPSPIPKSRACVHLPWRQSSETHLMQTLPLTGHYSGFFRASIFYSVKCSDRDHRTTSIYSVQGTEPWRKKKRLPSFHAREMHQGLVESAGKAVVWPGCLANRPLPVTLDGASLGSGYLTSVPSL